MFGVVEAPVFVMEDVDGYCRRAAPAALPATLELEDPILC